MISSTLQVSTAVGMAALGGLFCAALGTRTDPATVTHAFSITLLAIAACHIGGAFLAAGPGQRARARGECPALSGYGRAL